MCEAVLKNIAETDPKDQAEYISKFNGGMITVRSDVAQYIALVSKAFGWTSGRSGLRVAQKVLKRSVDVNKGLPTEVPEECDEHCKATKHHLENEQK